MLILKEIVKDYVAGDTTVRAMDHISINFRESEFVAILGPSGCGKTTMLNIIGGLDRYTEGDLIINGKSTKTFTDNDIENVLALRGDRPRTMTDEEYNSRDFFHASDMAEYIRKSYPSFTVAGACYPDKHFEARDYAEDIANLKKKVECGCSFLISQLFFDNEIFYRFMERSQIAGINVPIEAGIMPVTNANQIQRMVDMCGASLPRKFSKMIQKYGSNPVAMRDAGIAYAVSQIVDLIANGVDGIHLYTMNNPYVATEIYKSIKRLL